MQLSDLLNQNQMKIEILSERRRKIVKALSDVLNYVLAPPLAFSPKCQLDHAINLIDAVTFRLFLPSWQIRAVKFLNLVGRQEFKRG